MNRPGSLPLAELEGRFKNALLSPHMPYLAERSRPTTTHGRHEEGSCRGRAEGEENGDEETAGSKHGAPPRRGLGLLQHASDGGGAHGQLTSGLVAEDGDARTGVRGIPSGRSLACIIMWDPRGLWA